MIGLRLTAQRIDKEIARVEEELRYLQDRKYQLQKLCPHHYSDDKYFPGQCAGDSSSYFVCSVCGVEYE